MNEDQSINYSSVDSTLPVTLDEAIRSVDGGSTQQLFAIQIGNGNCSAEHLQVTKALLLDLLANSTTIIRGIIEVRSPVRIRMSNLLRTRAEIESHLQLAA